MDISLFIQNNLLHTQESLNRYQCGGYHPVRLGDKFKNSRYTIHHKLGWGGFSTVWLAMDEISSQWVSLKIMTADSSPSRELQNFKLLQRHGHGELSSHYILQLFDSFRHEGPNGLHQCLVFELLGPTIDKVLADYRETHESLHSHTVLKLSSQLLKAAQFIHDAGLCHGDISGRNLAFSCTELSRSTKKELFDVLGHPEIEELSFKDGTSLQLGLPSQLVKAAEWVDWIDEDDENLRLLDMGEGFLHGKEPGKLAQPGALRAPETIFTNSFDYRIDLWRIGCMIYSFVFATYPFWYLGEDAVLVLQMIGFVERLPPVWQSAWHSMRTKLPHNLEADEEFMLPRLERQFTEKVQDLSLKPLLQVISSLMRFIPDDRADADQAINLLPNILENYDSETEVAVEEFADDGAREDEKEEAALKED